MDIVEQHKDELFKLCDNHKVKELYLFGSVLTDKFNEASDIDMLVQFYHIDLLNYFDNYMDFKEQVELLYNRPVDLVENQAIRNPIFRNIIDRDKKLIYGRTDS